MARNGIQRRRRGTSKVVRKPQKHRNLRISNAVKELSIKDVYDPSLTPSENLKTLGLDANPNALNEIRPPGMLKNSAAFLGFASLSSTTMQAVDHNPNSRLISEWDAKYAQELVQKHGRDFKAMERDIKLNDRQLSANQARKLIEKYEQSLNEEDDE
jgi:hypothetical protein